MVNKNIEELKSEILASHENSYACKNFDKDKKISKEDFDFLLEVARLSPSSFGLEPWKFLIIENQGLKSKVLGTVPRLKDQLEKSSHLVVILAKKGNQMVYSSDYINYIMKDIKKVSDQDFSSIKEGIRRFQQKGSNTMNNEKLLYDWSLRQSYLPLANIISAASQIGIATCPVEEFDEKELTNLLEKNGFIDSKEFGVSVLLALGYGVDDNMGEKKRKPLEEVIQVIK